VQAKNVSEHNGSWSVHQLAPSRKKETVARYQQQADLVQEVANLTDNRSSPLADQGTDGRPEDSMLSVKSQYHIRHVLAGMLTTAKILLGISYIVYTVLCLRYELHDLHVAEVPLRLGASQGAPLWWTSELTSSAAAIKRDRNAPLDLVRFVLLFFIVFQNIHQTMHYNRNFHPAWEGFFTFPQTFDMSCCAIISGVLGAKVKTEAIAKVLCFTLGTLVLTKLVLNYITLVLAGGQHMSTDAGSMILWYLPSLLFWKLTISPMFHVARKRNTPAVIPFFVVICVSFLLRHGTVAQPFGMTWVDKCYFFAPFYAQGLLMTPHQWSNRLHDRRLTKLSACFLVCWIVLSSLPHSGLKRMTEVTCSFTETYCEHGYWPLTLQWGPRSLTFHNMFTDIRVYMLKDLISMSVIWIIASMVRPLRQAAPRVSVIVFGCGSRLMQGYILHMICVLHIGELLRVQIPSAPDWARVVFCCIVAAQATFVWSSRLTDRIFGWLAVPLWMQDAAQAIWVRPPRARDAGERQPALSLCP